MTASEARWQQYLNKKPDSRREYDFIMSQIKLFVKTPAKDIVVKITDRMIIAKLKHDGYKVEVFGAEDPENQNKYSVSW